MVLPALRGHKAYVSSAAFSPDGMRIVSASGDKTIRVWNVLSGTEECSPLRGHEEDVHSVAFTHDGKCIVSGSVDRTIRVWDVLSGTKVPPPTQGHKAWVSSVAFSQDGTRIRSHSNIDGTGYRVWDATSGLSLSFDADSTYDHASPRTIEVTRDGWIVDVSTDRTISKLPPMVTKISSAAHERSLVIGTRGGQVITMHFPPAVFAISETRLVEGREGRWQIDRSSG
jgi:WD40 repeat protein